MELLYLAGIFLYSCFIRLAANFNEKAARWIKGRIGWEENMRQKLASVPGPVIWMHCASLGEFEQGRAVLEELRKNYPDHRIVLTFFSPSGYNVLKETKLADAVFYLPLDTPENSRRFVSLLNPRLVIFVKYEFWHFYSRELQKRKIPFYCISAIFRPSQIFFRFYGKFFRRMLMRYDHLFVQDQDSLSLLYKYDIARVTVAGDTRFDRVWENKNTVADLPLLDAFCNTSGNVMVAGSTWPADESLLLETMHAIPGLRMVIAPHELTEAHLTDISRRFGTMAAFYSKSDAESLKDKRVLVIDNIGMLSRLYRFGQYTYVGGGFGAGIHNTLEAAVYGKPVFFGPRYDKFLEAKALVKNQIGFPVNQSSELIAMINKLNADEARLLKISDTANRYMLKQKGATYIIMSYLQLNFTPAV
jgi:3-deoxy-D-manno-octulosonic-acid transferase